MEITVESLKAMELPELRKVAEGMGIRAHANAKADTLIHKIMQQPRVAKATAVEKLENPSQYEAAPLVSNTQEEVLDALKKFTAKDGFKVSFLDDGKSWHFSYKGCEDSGSMFIPLRVIVMKAEVVSRGKRALMSMGNDGTYKGYADNILVG